MAIEKNVHYHPQTQHQSLQSFSLDALYCEEEKWGDVEQEGEEDEGVLDVCESNTNAILKNNNNNGTATNCPSSLFPPPLHLPLLEQDLFWEDEELLSLFSKEKETQHLASSGNANAKDPVFSAARREAVEWILKVNAYYGFSTLTAILAINYLDRFLSSLHYQKDKPWMIQLASLTCLSLAAKVEEIQVPLLLDFQVLDSKYVFEAKTIQKMELLILSTLKWRMNPVTPISFLDHIIRRLGLKSHVHWEFLRRCESLLLTVMPDSGFSSYLPSVLATAIMLHVIHQVDPYNAIDYENQLLEVLGISKTKVTDCYEAIAVLSSTSNSLKRKYDPVPSSPLGVMDAFFNSDSSNDSWVGTTGGLSGSSSPEEPQPLIKKSRAQEQQMRLPSLTRVFVDIVGSPR
ncbi:cyclin-D3-3-like [Coffea arabica]|uniref:Cyclin-D3-3-like n=1 Tax=Coffea arabica TaxID=13443 RepID=A0A6P6VVT2_COFAR|nr:cyclin-D3-1-like [Coffea arabica]